MELPSWVARILAIWTGIGSLFITGLIPLDDWLKAFFLPEVINATSVFIGSFIVYINVLKGAKIIKGGDAEIKAMNKRSQVKYAINPFAV